MSINFFLLIIFLPVLTFAQDNTFPATGSVGIATTDPQGTLQVNSIRPVVIKNNGGVGVYGSEIGFNSVLNTTVLPNKFRKLGGTGQNGGANLAVDYYGNIFFQMFNAGTESEVITDYLPQIVFRNNGNVGIGTMNPGGFRLAVEGKIGAREVNVTLTNPWPDYVFDSTYRRPLLSELDSFIRSNKHLPGVPTAAEVDGNGVNLGEMNAILLKKVEELTLYVIELKKEIDAFKDHAKESE